MNEFEYTREQGISLLDDFLLPRGYQRIDDEEDFEREPTWYKIVEDSSNQDIYVTQLIDIDLNAKVGHPDLFDFGLWVKSYGEVGSDCDDEVDLFIELLKEAREEVIKDLDDLYNFLVDKLGEKKPDNIYTLTLTYDDYGQFDENGIPGVSTDHELEYNSLDEALKDFYMSISFNDEDVTLYKGNKDITDEILADEALFKKYYDDEDARNDGHFKYLTYEQSWECIKEYADAGYSESIEKYLQDGIIK